MLHELFFFLKYNEPPILFKTLSILVCCYNGYVNINVYLKTAFRLITEDYPVFPFKIFFIFLKYIEYKLDIKCLNLVTDDGKY